MKVAAFQRTPFQQCFTEPVGWLALSTLVTPMLVAPVGAAPSPQPSPSVTASTTAAPESGLSEGAPPVTMAPVETSSLQLRLTQPTRLPRYGLSSTTPLAARIQPDAGGGRLPLSGRRQRLGMSGEAEVLAWCTGIGAAVGLAAGLRKGENAVESTLKGAGMGFILPIVLVGAVASTVPRVASVSPVRPTGLPTDGVSSYRLLDNAPPLLHLRISGQQGRGQADRYVSLGVGTGIRLSYVTGW